MSTRQVQARVSSGAWVRVHRGVYRSAAQPSPPLMRRDCSRPSSPLVRARPPPIARRSVSGDCTATALSSSKSAGRGSGSLARERSWHSAASTRPTRASATECRSTRLLRCVRSSTPAPSPPPLSSPAAWRNGSPTEKSTDRRAEGRRYGDQARPARRRRPAAPRSKPVPSPISQPTAASRRYLARVLKRHRRRPARAARRRDQWAPSVRQSSTTPTPTRASPSPSTATESDLRSALARRSSMTATARRVDASWLARAPPSRATALRDEPSRVASQVVRLLATSAPTPPAPTRS